MSSRSQSRAVIISMLISGRWCLVLGRVSDGGRRRVECGGGGLLEITWNSREAERSGSLRIGQGPPEGAVTRHKATSPFPGEAVQCGETVSWPKAEFTCPWALLTKLLYHADVCEATS